MDNFSKLIKDNVLMLSQNKMWDRSFTYDFISNRFHALGNQVPIKYRRLLIKDGPKFIDAVYGIANELDIPIREVEKVKGAHITKEYIIKNKIAGIMDSTRGKLYFYSIVLDRVVPMCSNHYKKCMKLKDDVFLSGVTIAALTHNFNEPEGSNGHSINSHSAAAYVFEN